MPMLLFSLKRVMSSRICNKCRQTNSHLEDSWCLGCTGIEALSIELRAAWQVPAVRNIAHDWILSTVRGVKALRHLCGSLQSAESSSRASLAAPVHPSREVDNRYKHLPPPPVPPVKHQPESSEEEYETEEEYPDNPGGPSRSSGARPPEPNYPPPGHKSESRRSGIKRDRGENKGEFREKRRRGNRAGARHQRLYRTVDNPEISVHRKPPAGFWHSESSLAGR